MAHNIHGTFVSEKVNKIRWRPDFMNASHYFVTGSWDNDQNSIKLWDFQENEEDAEVYPFLVAEFPHNGDITEVKFLNGDFFVASSSSGCVSLLKITSEHGIDPLIERKIYWEGVHKFPNGENCPCTAFCTYDNDIVSVGEDGSINLLNAQNQNVIRTIENADSCSIRCVAFLKHSEILTGNFRGQLKIFDIRAPKSQPATTFMLSGDQISPLCLQNHPTQRHLVVAGDEEGSITIWDLRQNTYPVNVLDAHEGGVMEIHFHPDHPDQLFTCSTDGDVWHWSPKCGSASSLLNGENVWLASEAIKNKLDVFTLMPKLHKPINSLDVNRNKVLCGCDNEAVYLINGVNVFK
ncbi:nucleoporin Nup43 [Tribolium castaneum]|uniref:Nucleoporin Nup43-like Protein n=1 Tax=Tribolium castaneum TaxID=7070 RepID=D6WMU7_TRICA|nr:PREDICTED: nucleoporin Nup43 [Tribolium castaneum]EFA03069.1 Nucleoporin Nup43-like Protein [Tribolium castaneum]|eukprot:XP_968010.1 PREDICTED: nucleoporin Nup43 [Tribolium castaneum]